VAGDELLDIGPDGGHQVPAVGFEDDPDRSTNGRISRIARGA
jgi:hypothetical protein